MVMKTALCGLWTLWSLLPMLLANLFSCAELCISTLHANPLIALLLVPVLSIAVPVGGVFFVVTAPLQIFCAICLAPAALFLIVAIVYFQPDIAISFAEWCCPDVFWRASNADRKDRRVALTIDDVPLLDSPTSLGEILDILKANNAKATFMVMSGFRERDKETVEHYMSLLRRAIAEGHELGNHNMVDEPAASLASTEFNEKVQHCDALLRDLYGDEAWEARCHKWHRPGSGFWTRNIIETTKAMGYKTVLANCIPGDAFAFTRFANAAYLRLRARPGCIVLLHDRWHTPATLRAALPTLSRYLDLCTLTELEA